MKLFAAVLLAIASAIPLIVLVTRADKRRHAVAELRRIRALGLITQEETEQRTSGVLDRSLWLRDNEPKA